MEVSMGRTVQGSRSLNSEQLLTEQVPPDLYVGGTCITHDEFRVVRKDLEIIIRRLDHNDKNGKNNYNRVQRKEKTTFMCTLHASRGG